MSAAKPGDNPFVADQRVADALWSVLPDAADRAVVLVAVAMAVKAHRMDARRAALAECAAFQWERDCARIAGEVERGMRSRGEVI